MSDATTSVPALPDLIERLRARAMIEAPPDNEPDTRAAFDDVPEITFDELWEISGLLNEAADALASVSRRLAALEGEWRAIATARAHIKHSAREAFKQCADALARLPQETK